MTDNLLQNYNKFIITSISVFIVLALVQYLRKIIKKGETKKEKQLNNNCITRTTQEQSDQIQIDFEKLDSSSTTSSEHKSINHDSYSRPKRLIKKPQRYSNEDEDNTKLDYSPTISKHDFISDDSYSRSKRQMKTPKRYLNDEIETKLNNNVVIRQKDYPKLDSSQTSRENVTSDNNSQLNDSNVSTRPRRSVIKPNRYSNDFIYY